MERRQQLESLIRAYLILAFAMLAYAAVATSAEWLPSRFLNDSRRIAYYLRWGTGFSADGSYDGTLSLMKAVGLDRSPLWAGMITVTLFLAIAFSVCPLARIASIPTAAFAVLLASMAASCAFFAQYNKETFTCALFLLYVRAQRPWQLVGVALAAALYGVTVRQYWVLFVVTAVALWFVTVRWHSARALAITVAGAVVSNVLLVRAATGQSVAAIRASVLDAISVTPDTAVSVPVHAVSPLADIVNVAYVAATLLVPWPLLDGSPVHLLGFVLVASCWALAVVAARRAFGPGAPRRVNRDICVVFAFVVVLALFEPDYGSYLRHVLPVIPLVVRTYTDVRLAKDRESESHANTARH